MSDIGDVPDNDGLDEGDKDDTALESVELESEEEEDTQITGASLEEDDAAIERERVSAQNAYQPEQKEPVERGRKPFTSRDLILNEISHRIERDKVRLRPVLAGKILFEITDKKERYLFDWSGDQLNVTEAGEQSGDCTITTTEREFLRVANGELNPQVSMLSGKIKVKGKTSLAIYIFNLIAPKQFVH